MNEPSQKSRLCEICGSEIPKKPVLTLEELGYTGCEIRSPFRKMLYFCPNHLPKEIATCIGDVVQRGCNAGPRKL